MMIWLIGGFKKIGAISAATGDAPSHERRRLERGSSRLLFAYDILARLQRACELEVAKEGFSLSHDIEADFLFGLLASLTEHIVNVGLVDNFPT